MVLLLYMSRVGTMLYNVLPVRSFLGRSHFLSDRPIHSSEKHKEKKSKYYFIGVQKYFMGPGARH